MVLDGRVGRYLLANFEGASAPRRHRVGAEPPQAGHVHVLASADEVVPEKAAIGAGGARLGLDVALRKVHGDVAEERLRPREVGLTDVGVGEVVGGLGRVVGARWHEVEDTLDVRGGPRPQTLGRMGVAQRRPDARLERAEVALGNGVLVLRVGDRLGVQLNELGRHGLHLGAVEARLVVRVPAGDAAVAQPVLDPPLKVLERGAELSR